MSFQIQDGSGSGHFLKVDDTGRAQAFSVSATLQNQAAITGDSYNVNTGSINLTSSNESAVAYIKNNGDTPVHILQLGYLVGASTGGTGEFVVTIKRNPTNGTITSNALPVDMNVNKNFSSTKQLNVDVYKGAEGHTIVGTEDAYKSLIPSAPTVTVINTGTIILERGASIGVTAEPPAGNTSMNMQVYFAIINYNF